MVSTDSKKTTSSHKVSFFWRLIDFLVIPIVGTNCLADVGKEQTIRYFLTELVLVSGIVWMLLGFPSLI